MLHACLLIIRDLFARLQPRMHTASRRLRTALHAALCVAALTIGLVGSASAQTASVDTVEPPNWWTGMQWNEVQLMLYGDDLDHLAATVPEDGVRVTGVQTVPSHSYAFVTLAIANDAPGHERRLPASGHRGPRRTRTARGDCRVGPHRVRAPREM